MGLTLDATYLNLGCEMMGFEKYSFLKNKTKNKIVSSAYTQRFFSFWSWGGGGELKKTISRNPYLTAPLISPKAKKILGFFLVKDLFFSIGKKGRGLTAPPLIFAKNALKGGGAVRWVSTDQFFSNKNLIVCGTMMNKMELFFTMF